ncbi:MAG: exodeoxyribonuclease VII large subunit, partial [Mariprofundaceae bacterium]
EDLWCFNDEQVVKAIVDCPIPVISGIGHEIDVTLADFASDVRAATPSNAVEVSCPSRVELRERLPRMTAVAGLMRQHMLRFRREVHQLKQRQQHHWERRADAGHHACEQGLSLLRHHAQNATKHSRQQLRKLEKQLARFEPGQRLRRQRGMSSGLETRLQAVMFRTQQQQRHRLHQWQEKLSTQTATLVMRPEHALLHSSQRLQRLRGEMIARHREAGHAARHDLGIRANQHIEHLRQQLALLAGQLHALGPNQVLQRGYSLSYTVDGALITKAARLRPGDAMQVRFQDGTVSTEVKSISGEQQ